MNILIRHSTMCANRCGNVDHFVSEHAFTIFAGFGARAGQNLLLASQ
jgi:hypothetical protein